jgi:2-dehydropantoate 2-reductase
MVAGRPKITVFGAGMIGLYVGGLLSPHAEVTFVGRASMLDPLADGLRLTDVDGLDLQLGAGDFRATTDAAGLAGADLVLVTVKSMGTAEAAAAISARLIPASLPIVTGRATPRAVSSASISQARSS